MNQEEKDGWREWSKHILNALDRLDKQLDMVRSDINKANLDIAKVGHFSNNLLEIENKLTRIREDIITHSENVKAAISSLEDDDSNNMQSIESKLDVIGGRVSELETFATRTKTIGYVIASVIAALIGMLSFSLKDLFR